MKIKVIFSLLFFIFFLSCNNTTQELDGSDDYVPPVPMQWKTESGINVIYYNDKELPLVRAGLYIKGSVEKSKNPLLLEAMGSLLKLGGTKNYPIEKLDLKLEKLSATLSSSWGSEYGVISFTALPEDTEELFKIVSDMIFNPSFDKKELELWKLKKIDAIKRRADSPSAIAKAKYISQVYKSSNYGYVSTIDDVEKINQKDLFEEKELYLIPNEVYLTLVGPITKKKINRILNTYFASWNNKKQNIELQQNSTNKKIYRYNAMPKQIYFMKKDDLNQATLYIVSKGPKRDELKHLKYALYSEYLGTGGFSSILLKDLRTKQGLVYSTYGGVFPGFPYGTSTIFIETSDDKLCNALISTEKIINNLKDVNNISKETLVEVKNAMLNAEIFKTSDLDNLIDRKFIFDFWGFSNNYDRLYRKRIKNFNVNDIVEISKQYMNLEDSFVVIVASSQALNNLKGLLKDNETIFSKYNLNICNVNKVGLCEK